jgi:RNA polymerase sigma factor for flagellar operon FliA
VTSERLSPQQTLWVEQCLPRVQHMARVLAPKMPHASQEELESAGYEGLVQAALRYEPESGVPFGAFAHYRVRGAMIDAARAAAPALRRKSRAVRSLAATQELLEREAAAQPAADRADPRSLRERVAAAAALVHKATTAVLLTRVAPDDPDGVIDEVQSDAESQLLDAELRRTLLEVIDGADDDEKLMVRALYFEGITMQELAERTGKNKSTVSRHHAKLLATLGERLRERLGG